MVSSNGPHVYFNDAFAPYVRDFDFSQSLSLQSFEPAKEGFKQIQSNSGLRKIYDAYLDILSGNKDEDHKAIQISIWFAKIGYQESRGLLPSGFFDFLKEIYAKIPEKEGKKFENFRDFLEVFVAYHRYFNPDAK